MSSPDPSPDQRSGEGVYASLRQKAAAELAESEVEVATSVWSRIEAFFVGGLAMAALLLCSYNVFVRYLYPPLTLELSEEVQVYLIVWAVFLALGAVTLADRHVKADLFVNMFPANVRKWLEIATDVLGFAFALVLVVYGAEIAWQAWSYGDLSTTTLRFPLWIYISALPVGALVMGASYVVRIVRIWRGQAPARTQAH